MIDSFASRIYWQQQEGETQKAPGVFHFVQLEEWSACGKNRVRESWCLTS